MELKTAKSYMKPELRNILKECFNENDRAIDVLLKKLFNEDMTAVCIVDGKVVSSVFILENSIIYNGTKIPSCYLYAVATLPKFQGKGYMKKLLKFAEDIAIKKGKVFSTLYPATQQLYGFYEKFRYQNFFKTNIVEIDKNNINDLLNNKSYNKCEFENLQLDSTCKIIDNKSREIDFSYLEEIRRNAYNKSGEVYWDKSILEYACLVNEIYGGKTILNGNNYAICREVDDVVEIVDSVITEDNLLLLLKQIDNIYNAKRYIFRLPLGRQQLKIKGKEIPFGMIKPLTSNENYNKILYEIKNPYLGLVMD